MSAYERARRVAHGPGRWVACAWAVAEAVVWPIVPDVVVAALAGAAPRRAPALALWATAGSVAGGMAAYALGAAGPGAQLLAHAPLVTERMVDHAGAWLATEGAVGLVHQPLTGVPFKVFGLQAAGAGVGFLPFVAFAAVVRGVRLPAVALVFALGGAALRHVLPRWYGALLAVGAGAFVAGLRRAVEAWS
ncbi:MAG TPA: hypothetical protein VHJ34_07035 [Actinomycetota bacterium]|nr:hypothetical protein [Actinomycetota bacterium]